MFQQQAKEGGGEKGVEYNAIPYISFIFLHRNAYIFGGWGAWTYDVTPVLLRVICTRFIEPCASLL